MSPQYSHISCRHGPHGVDGSSDCVTTAMAVNSNALRVQARGFYEHLGYSVIKTQNAFRKKLN